MGLALLFCGIGIWVTNDRLLLMCEASTTHQEDKTMFSMVMGAFGRMDAGFWGTKAVAIDTIEQQIQAVEEQAAYREALTYLRAAQSELARPVGRWGADKNEILAREIELAIREIHSAGVAEVEEPAVADGTGKYSAAFQWLGLAEQALERVPKKRAPRKQALVHVRVAKWWVQPKASPRYTQILKHTQS
jgi:hypothetical protein